MSCVNCVKTFIILALCASVLSFQSVQGAAVSVPNERDSYQAWETLISSAILSIELQHYDDAEKDLRTALSSPLLEAPHQAITLQLLEDLYEIQSKYTEEEKVLLEYLDLVTNNNYFAPNRQSETLVKLAAVSSRLENFRKGQGYLERALPLLKIHCGPRSPEYAVALNNLGWTKYRQNKLKESEMHVQQSLNIVQETLGTTNLFYGLAAYNLADIYLKSGRKSLALDWYQKALTAFIHSVGKDDELSKEAKTRCDQLRSSKRKPMLNKPPKPSPKPVVQSGSAHLDENCIPGVCFSDFDMAG